MSLNEPAESNSGQIICQFNPNVMTYQGFWADEELQVYDVTEQAGTVKISFATYDGHYSLNRLGNLSFVSTENSQMSGQQSSLHIVADYVVKEGDEKIILSQSGEASISIR